MKRNKYTIKILQIALWICGTIAIWAIIRFFFIPPILDGVTFSRAYTDRDNKLLRLTLTPDDKYRIFTPLNEISPHIQTAVILYEDKHFYNHYGINPISLLRAARQYLAGTPHPVGASTITMQVARMRYDIPSKTIGGKLAQIALAVYLDLFHSKSEILEAYLNLAPYGANIEGIGAASLIYFDKPAADLTKIESITLATIPQNPVKRGLNTKSGLTNIFDMRRELVQKWVIEYPNDTNLISLAEMPLNTHKTGDLPFLAPHFIDNLNTKQFKKSSARIQTTLDLNLQEKMEHRLQSEINGRRAIGITNAAAILVNYKTMQVLSYIGSADYFNRDIYGENDGVRARRSPGSTLKPLIYATAIDMGLIHSMTLLKDTPVNFGVYAPENSDNEFYGPVLARDALIHSRNIPAINLLREIGIDKFHKVLSDSGVSNLRNPEHYGVSVALGGAEVSMMELADIYATMANLGTHRKIQTTMTAPDEKLGNILSPEAFFLTLDMLGQQKVPLRNIPFTRAQKTPLHHYWKTGTSSSYRDAWTAGIFGDFVLIVWVGNFDGTPNNSFSGPRAAAPIYFALASTVTDYYTSRGMPPTDNNFLTQGLNIISVDMCATGGNIAGPYCPDPVASYFIPGKSPITRNNVHRMIPIDNKTGLRACTSDSKTTRNVVYEFWDSEYLDMFRRAGIHRNTPPPYMPGCEIIDSVSDFAAPIIVSPTPDTKTVITSKYDYEPVAFIGLATTMDAKIFWFMDDETLGSTKSGESLIYKVPMGAHHIRATDTNGNTTDIEFSVVK